jgi:23S rRNA pseudouridine1911/1915/1917 synthase
MMHNSDSLPTSSSTPRQLLSVQPAEAGQRLDRYLVSQIANLSRTSIQQMIDVAAIQVNGRPSKPGYILRANDEILVDLTTTSVQEHQIKPQKLPLEIVYEDNDLLIINKAPGMVVHPAPGHYEDTLVNALLAYYPDLQAFDTDHRPGIVHRLDRDTSGLLIVAKNARTQATLIEQMQRHEIVKRYLALVEGIVSLDQGSIDAPIGRDPRHRQQMTITATSSREARTHFRVLERFARHTLLLLQLETGRTHQIRVHLKAIGHPVAGDTTYGSGNVIRGSHLPRQFLHAYQLQFAHPITNAPLEFEAPLPDDLQIVLDHKNFL